jgi:hypothetical protein
MEPHEIPEQPIPVALQITTPLSGPLAVNCIWPPGFTCGKLGEIESPEAVAAVTVTVALADWLGAATAVAVTVIVGEAGIVAGAAYKPEAEIDPHAEPAQPEPKRVHFTDEFVVPVTFAENCCCAPTLTWADCGDTEIMTDAGDSITTVATADFVASAIETALTAT